MRELGSGDLIPRGEHRVQKPGKSPGAKLRVDSKSERIEKDVDRRVKLNMRRKGGVRFLMWGCCCRVCFFRL